MVPGSFQKFYKCQMRRKKKKKAGKKERWVWSPCLSNTSEITPAIPSATSYTHACYLPTGLTPQRKTYLVYTQLFLIKTLSQTRTRLWIFSNCNTQPNFESLPKIIEMRCTFFPLLSRHHPGLFILQALDDLNIVFIIH